MSTRLLGTLGLIGGAAYVVLAVYAAVARVAETSRDPLSILLGMIWIVGAICSWIGIFLVRGTGENVAIRFLTLLPIVGLTIVLVLSIYSAVNGMDAFDNPVFGTALMVELFGIVLNAIFAVAAKALPGWRRFAPLMVLLGFIAGGLIGALSQGALLGIPLGLGVGYALLGYAVMTLSPVRAANPVAA